MGTQTQSCVRIPMYCFNATGDRLLRTTGVARRIGKTPRMVRYLAEAGLIAGLKHGKLWFFRESDVIRYVRARETEYVQ